MPNKIEIKVRGYHVDVYGHVNNARYLEFLEEARWAMVEDRIDLEEWKKRGWMFFVVNINIDYKYPASMGDILEIETALSRVGKKSSVLKQTVFFKSTDQVVVDADVTFVVADANTGKALSFDGQLRSELDRFAH